MDLNQFLEWQKEGKDRKVTIEIGSCVNRKKIHVWAYDYKLQVGQIVESVDEIDLEAEKAKEDKAEYERFKRKFEREINYITRRD